MLCSVTVGKRHRALVVRPVKGFPCWTGGSDHSGVFEERSMCWQSHTCQSYSGANSLEKWLCCPTSFLDFLKIIIIFADVYITCNFLRFQLKIGQKSARYNRCFHSPYLSVYVFKLIGSSNIQIYAHKHITFLFFHDIFVEMKWMNAGPPLWKKAVPFLPVLMILHKKWERRGRKKPLGSRQIECKTVYEIQGRLGTC